MGWNPFLIELARYASQGERLQRLAVPAVDQIRLYFPPDLGETLSRCPESSQRDALQAECEQERIRWERGKPKAEGRESLRRRVIQYSHDTAIEQSLKRVLVQSASGIGTA